LIAVLLSGLLCGCTWLFTDADSRTGVSSSLVDYLYPRGEVPPPPEENIPRLEIPIRVGLAFVPGTGEQALTEAQRLRLLEQVRSAFKDREFIEAIEIIPETYMRQGRGFDTLESMARLYRVEAMALVSYDQVAFVGDAGSSIWYWTIVGAYVVKGRGASTRYRLSWIPPSSTWERGLCCSGRRGLIGWRPGLRSSIRRKFAAMPWRRVSNGPWPT